MNIIIIIAEKYVISSYFKLFIYQLHLEEYVHLNISTLKTTMTVLVHC